MLDSADSDSIASRIRLTKMELGDSKESGAIIDK
jgi:hypothetical protein